MEKDRRKYPRVNKRIRITFHKKKFFFLKGPKDLGEVVDISKSGIKINTKTDLFKGDMVVLLINKKVIDPLVLFNGKVVWAKKLFHKDKRFIQAGIKFSKLNSEQRVLILRLSV